MSELNRLDAITRRNLMTSVAQAALGVSIVPTAAFAGSARTITRPGQAKHVIYLFMNGAMTHLDTFDPKPGSDVQGPTSPISTAISGVQFSEHLPKLAALAGDLAVVRSMFTETGAHEQGRYMMHTSYKPIATTRHPCLASWAHKIAGRYNKSLPGSVVIAGDARHPGAGFLSGDFAPAPIGSAARGLENTKSPSYLKEAHFDKRKRLIARFDRSFRSEFQNKAVDSYVDFYREATRLLKSEDLKVFDINQEKKPVRDAYGNNPLGQGCLLARRLVEKKVRFVEVNYGGWDMHRDCFTAIASRGGILDQAVSQLIRELKQRGLFDETLVVIATEFGRTPKINENTGRDHHPGAFSCVLAGAGIRGGQAYGKSDAKAMSVESDHVSVEDFNATIATAMGLPIEKELSSPDGRPFKVAHDGTPVQELLA